MKKHLSKKRVVLAAIVAVALTLASGVAYAYWTSGGSGSGTAAAGTSTDNLTISATGWAGLAPGAANAKPVNVVVQNPNTYSAHVNNVVFGSVTTSDAGCLPAWFTVTGSPLNLNADIGAGLSTASTSFGTITMNDLTSTNQDACKSPTTITIHFTSN
jgi:hypothetical protein